MMGKNGYPKVEYYYKLIQEIFELCNWIGKKKIDINFIKIKSHIGNSGNRTADLLAKEATNIAKMCKLGQSNFIKYDMRKNHVTVDSAKDLIQFRKREKEKRKIEWEKIRIERMGNKKDTMVMEFLIKQF